MDRQSIYKSYENKSNHSLRTAKRLYYQKKLNDVQSNTRATWKVLNEILNKRKEIPIDGQHLKLMIVKLLILSKLPTSFVVIFQASVLIQQGVYSRQLHTVVFLMVPLNSQYSSTLQLKMRSLRLRKLFFQAKQLATTRFQ